MTDIEYLTQNIQTMLSNGTFINTIQGADHMDDKHTNKSGVYQIDRMLKEDKLSVSSFPDKPTLDFALDETLYFNARYIAKWLLESDNYNQESFNADLSTFDDAENMGLIYHRDTLSGKIKTYKPSTCRVILEHNEKWSQKIRLVSAFPFYDELSKPYENDMSILTDMRQTETYKKSSVLEKLHLESLCDPRLPVCNLNKDHSVLFMDYQETENATTKHVFSFTEHDATHFVRTTANFGLMLKHPYKEKLGITSSGDKLSLIKYPKLKEELRKDIPQTIKQMDIIWNRIQELSNVDTTPMTKTHFYIKDIDMDNDPSKDPSDAPDYG